MPDLVKVHMKYSTLAIVPIEVQMGRNRAKPSNIVICLKELYIPNNAFKNDSIKSHNFVEGVELNRIL